MYSLLEFLGEMGNDFLREKNIYTEKGLGVFHFYVDVRKTPEYFFVVGKCSNNFFFLGREKIKVLTSMVLLMVQKSGKLTS